MTVWSRLAAGMAILAWAGVAMAQPVTLRMWMHEHPPRIAIDRKIIAEFEKANPDLKVQYEVIPVAEYGTKLLTAFAAGSGPDVFNQSSTLVTQYFNARVLAPVDYAAMGLADEAALTSQYVGGFDGIRFQSRLYGVPTEVSNWACFANNAIWREAGPRSRQGLAEDLGGGPGGGGETHPARRERRAASPRLRLQLADPRHVLVHAQHHDAPTGCDHDRRGQLQGDNRHAGGA